MDQHIPNPLDFSPAVADIVIPFIADVIAISHKAANGKWGLTRYRPDIRVNVGWTEILTTGRESIRLIVVKSLLPKHLLQSTLKFGLGYSSIPDSLSVTIPYSPLNHINESLLHLRPALAEAISRSGRRGVGRTVRASHSPEIVNEIGLYTGRLLPQPVFYRSAYEYKVSNRHWWVNQNKTYTVEVTGGFLWSPKTRADGARNQFYENMTMVEPGDIVFSFSSTQIKAIGVATGRADPSPKPHYGKAGGSWSEDGWLVPVTFKELKRPFRPKNYMELLRPHLPAKYSPLQKSGDGIQSVYLAEVPESMAEKLGELIGPDYATVVRELQVGVDDSILQEDAEEEAIKGRVDIGSTTTTQLYKARRGQGIFRMNVQLNEKRCRVTGITDLVHLRASHIKPWADSTNEEKLSGCNGLLLAPHIDHLFDKGYISFTDNGQMLISEELDKSLLKAWGIVAQADVGPFKKEQTTFLQYHRIHRFKTRPMDPPKGDSTR